MSLPTNQKTESPRGEALRFALVMFVALGAIAAWVYFRRHRVQTAGVLAGVGATLLVLSVIAPKVVLGFRWLWMKVGGVLGWINSRVILSVIYFIVLTPLAFFRRVFTKDQLESNFPGPAGSHWRMRDEEYDPKHFERSF
jgi:hypothetical protein